MLLSQVRSDFLGQAQCEWLCVCCTYLLDFMVLSEQSVGAVGDAHGDDAHATDHYHGYVDIREDGHDSGS